MDQTSLPDAADWDVLKDGVPEAIDAFAWLNPTTVRTTINQLHPTVSGVIRILQVDVDCKSLEGQPAWSPEQSTFFPP